MIPIEVDPDGESVGSNANMIRSFFLPLAHQSRHISFIILVRGKFPPRRKKKIGDLFW